MKQINFWIETNESERKFYGSLEQATRSDPAWSKLLDQGVWVDMRTSHHHQLILSHKHWFSSLCSAIFFFPHASPHTKGDRWKSTHMRLSQTHRSFFSENLPFRPHACKYWSFQTFVLGRPNIVAATCKVNILSGQRRTGLRVNCFWMCSEYRIGWFCTFFQHVAIVFCVFYVPQSRFSTCFQEWGKRNWMYRPWQLSITECVEPPCSLPDPIEYQYPLLTGGRLSIRYVEHFWPLMLFWWENLHLIHDMNMLL